MTQSNKAVRFPEGPPLGLVSFIRVKPSVLGSEEEQQTLTLSCDGAGSGAEAALFEGGTH